VNQTIFQFEENTIITGPLAVISVPEGQEVILGSSSTPSAFQIQNDQLFLIATLDYEVQVAGLGGHPLPFPRRFLEG
jgi:hypothetical protein